MSSCVPRKIAHGTPVIPSTSLVTKNAAHRQRRTRLIALKPSSGGKGVGGGLGKGEGTRKGKGAGVAKGRGGRTWVIRDRRIDFCRRGVLCEDKGVAPTPAEPDRGDLSADQYINMGMGVGKPRGKGFGAREGRDNGGLFRWSSESGSPVRVGSNALDKLLEEREDDWKDQLEAVTQTLDVSGIQGNPKV